MTLWKSCVKPAVRVVTGETSRIKGVDVDTGPGSAAARQIEEWMGDGGTD